MKPLLTVAWLWATVTAAQQGELESALARAQRAG